MRRTVTNKQKSAGKKPKTMKKSLKEKLDRVFSLYIRLRDTDENGYFRCPTCGRIKTFKDADCSHYWSRTHTSTRFDEDNCVTECRYCNRFDSSHLDGLGKFLVKKLGQQRFDLLNWKHNQPKKYSESEYALLIQFYQKEIIKLKKQKNFIV